MKVKIFDESHEKDLEQAINEFIEDKQVIDIKYSSSIAITKDDDQLYSFTALIIYTV